MSFHMLHVKVDDFSAWSPPRDFTVPSATVNMNLSPPFWHYHLFRIESFNIDVCIHLFQRFQIHPRTKRIQGTIQVRLSFQFDGFVTGLFGDMG